jgi:hypothetical protein
MSQKGGDDYDHSSVKSKQKVVHHKYNYILNFFCSSKIFIKVILVHFQATLTLIIVVVIFKWHLTLINLVDKVTGGLSQQATNGGMHIIIQELQVQMVYQLCRPHTIYHFKTIKGKFIYLINILFNFLLLSSI